MAVRVVLPGRLAEAAKVAAFNGCSEAGAWVLASNVSVQRLSIDDICSRRLIVREIIPLTQADIASASSSHLTVQTDSYVKLLQKADKENLIPGFLHGHPESFNGFSRQDDENEQELLRVAKNRNGPDTDLLSLLVQSDDSVRARIWNSPTQSKDCDIWISGGRCSLIECTGDHSTATPSLDRQRRLFGEPFNKTLQQLTVVVVGAGGTGSPIATMLARGGVAHLTIIDDDIVDETNLHRLHGARMSDIGKPKANVLVEYINSLGLTTKARAVVSNVLEKNCRDELKAADVVFCATDDHAGRLLLNRYSYFYETPVVDSGLAADVDSSGNILDMTGRVTVLHPGVPCLLCRNILDLKQAREEELRRQFPKKYARQLEEGYILSGGDPEPAFIGMTTSVACMAIEEFTQLLSGFRGHKRKFSQRFRRFHVPEDRCVGGVSKPTCPICASTAYWGRGDIIPFLDRMD